MTTEMTLLDKTIGKTFFNQILKSDIIWGVVVFLALQIPSMAFNAAVGEHGGWRLMTPYVGLDAAAAFLTMQVTSRARHWFLKLFIALPCVIFLVCLSLVANLQFQAGAAEANNTANANERIENIKEKESYAKEQKKYWSDVKLANPKDKSRYGAKEAAWAAKEEKYGDKIEILQSSALPFKMQLYKKVEYYFPTIKAENIDTIISLMFGVAIVITPLIVLMFLNLIYQDSTGGNGKTKKGSDATKRHWWKFWRGKEKGSDATQSPSTMANNGNGSDEDKINVVEFDENEYNLIKKCLYLPVGHKDHIECTSRAVMAANGIGDIKARGYLNLMASDNGKYGNVIDKYNKRFKIKNEGTEMQHDMF